MVIRYRVLNISPAFSSVIIEEDVTVQSAYMKERTEKEKGVNLMIESTSGRNK
jgi:hypothetical protein